MDSTERAELFLVPLDPQRGFRRIYGDLIRFVELDPKLRAAGRLLDERFAGHPPDDRLILSTVLWAYVRSRLKGSDSVNSIRRWLRDGDSVLRTVEDALETTFSEEVLREVIAQGRQFAEHESVDTTDFEQARTEVAELEALDVVAPFVVGFLIGYGAASLYCDTFGC